LKGYLIEGFTALRSMTGTEGALKAMRTNEKITNKNYDKALSQDLPADVAAIVRRNRDDERRHLEYIETALSNRVWETAAHPSP
jgi:demethoxyubiquinone hydroxylase (CLK1/Coq7/Cat5 family)